MVDTNKCPNCDYHNQSNQTICANCGMNLAIAATLAEIALAKQFAEPANLTLSPEILVPRIGDYLVEKGQLTTEQLEMGLKFQMQQNASGRFPMLGQILVQQGVIDQTNLDIAITEQIFLLQEALRKSNNELEQRVKERTLELQQALQKLTQLNHLKTNFVSNISHELRTPLAHMVGYIDLLREEALGPLTPDQTQATEVLYKSYNRLYSLIDELIQFSMLSQGEMTIYQESVSTNSLVQTAISHPSQTASEKQVVLLVENPVEEIQVFADQEKISWVLGELIENAIKFNNPGGQVILRLNQLENMVNFQVIDNGIGIHPDDLSVIFDAFHQLDGSSTRKVGGTGIGLALAKQILEAHGTQLKVKSVPDKGSNFHFLLPQV